MKSIDYLKNNEILKKFENASIYQKSAKTMLRIPNDNEFETTFFTYVKDGNDIRKESTNTISEDSIVARNPNVIGFLDGKEVYNEWLIAKSVIIKNYGQDVLDSLSTEFVGYKKKATVKAIKIAKEILDILNIEGEEMFIKVSWSPEPMVAKIGDYLTGEGYSISSHDMKDYDLLIPQFKKPKIDIVEEKSNINFKIN